MIQNNHSECPLSYDDAKHFWFPTLCSILTVLVNPAQTKDGGDHIPIGANRNHAQGILSDEAEGVPITWVVKRQGRDEIQSDQWLTQSVTIASLVVLNFQSNFLLTTTPFDERH